MREIVLPAAEAVKTLEKFLSAKFPIGYVRKVFRKNGARVNGRRAKETDLVRGGDRIQLFIPFEPRATPANAARDPIDVIFEDGGLLVVDKPPGLAVHEGKTVAKAASLLGILEKRFRDAPERPRLIHRLDKETSGVLLVAKNRRVAEELIARFETREVTKEYLCLLAGRLPANEGEIDFPLPGREGHAVRALTRYRVTKRFTETTLVRASIATGRLHQIRLHFAKLGFPVVLDDQHGDFPFNKRFRREYGLKRQFLHAETLAIAYRGETRRWSAPLAADLQQVLRKLEERRRV